ncbi:MAG TPA: chromosomal replication initiator protein DnaA [Candidatus Scatosoma pullicola]|nr:chromosomal replication initiator protein DnaA [Candidatus Scatosoma pullicola]
MAEQSQINFLWKQIREKAEEIIPPVSFNAFIKDLEPVDVINRRIYLKASSDLAANTIMKRQAAPLRDAISRCDLGISDFRLVVDGSDVYNFETEEDFGEDFKPVPINKNFTFDSFVVGSSNKFVYAAAKSVAEHPGESFNPLFIYGESGLGKTHLMQAIANYVEKNNPGKRVLYTTCDNFLNEFIDSMISGKISSRDKGARFRLHYRNVDILMIDDIQFLAKKPGVQEEFFHTFNELSSQNKQIVLTSDRPPKEIATLEERLRTRFEGGLIADIQPPDLETKIAILKRKALERKCHMPDDVLEFLAGNSGHDVRTLEGRLTKVLFASKLHEEPISLDLARRALAESVSETESSGEITPENIISAVCGYYKFRREDLLGKGKKADLVKARQICAYLICEMLSLPLVSVGAIMGGRDHTTIMYSRDKVDELIKLNEKMAKEVDDIKNIVLKQ